MITQQQLLDHASGAYLCMPLPSNWHDLDETAQNTYMQDNAWQPFEYHSGYQIGKYIETARYTLHRFLISNGIEVEDE